MANEQLNRAHRDAGSACTARSRNDQVRARHSLYVAVIKEIRALVLDFMHALCNGFKPPDRDAHQSSVRSPSPSPITSWLTPIC
ncbi:MAG: hypothetical protein ACLUB2_05825 [Butyricicoccus pullicaecorum]